MGIKREITIEDLTPEELAEEFSHMDDEKQARFFNELGRVVATWERSFCFQLQYVTDNPILTTVGRETMAEIGAYAWRTD